MYIKLFLTRIAHKLLILKSLTRVHGDISGIQGAIARTRSTVPTLRAPVIGKFSRERIGVEAPSTRRSPRIRLQVPVFIRGTDASGSDFIELTKTLNISAFGACITSEHVLRPDQTIHLTIPAPSGAPASLVPSETPPIIARVLRQESAGETRLFGLEFLRPLE
jgi:hypothetical protein